MTAGISDELTVLTLLSFDMSRTECISNVFGFPGVYGLGFYGLAKSGNYPQLMDSLQSLHMSAATVWVAKYIVAWPLVYHTLNGVRHLVSCTYLTRTHRRAVYRGMMCKLRPQTGHF